MAKPRYQTEPTELTTSILQQGFITPLQLFRIVAWKSAKGMANLTLNSEIEIRERTARVIELARTWEGVDVLKQAVGGIGTAGENRPDHDRSERTERPTLRGETEGLLALQALPIPSRALSFRSSIRRYGRSSTNGR